MFESIFCSRLIFLIDYLSFYTTSNFRIRLRSSTSQTRRESNPTESKNFDWSINNSIPLIDLTMLYICLWLTSLIFLPLFVNSSPYTDQMGSATPIRKTRKTKTRRAPQTEKRKRKRGKVGNQGGPAQMRHLYARR